VVDDPFSRQRIQAAYDVAAEDYEAAFGADLNRLPVDRRMLDQARDAAKDGPILDLGCGTGSAASYLARYGARVVGMDLSDGMLRLCTRAGEAQRLPAARADMRRLPFRTGAFAAVVAFYSIHNVARGELDGVLVEIARALEPGGTLLTATHLGEGEVYTERFLGHPIATTGGTLYTSDELVGRLSSNGFNIESIEMREPLQHEHRSDRIYLLATRAD
jgi:SAM-dependent methyltransferase